MLNIRLDTDEERISKLEDKSKENLWTKTEMCLENTEKRIRCVEHGWRVPICVLNPKRRVERICKSNIWKDGGWESFKTDIKSQLEIRYKHNFLKTQLIT